LFKWTKLIAMFTNRIESVIGASEFLNSALWAGSEEPKTPVCRTFPPNVPRTWRPFRKIRQRSRKYSDSVRTLRCRRASCRKSCRHNTECATLLGERVQRILHVAVLEMLQHVDPRVDRPRVVACVQKVRPVMNSFHQIVITGGHLDVGFV
jgi:hypothetical protein